MKSTSVSYVRNTLISLSNIIEKSKNVFATVIIAFMSLLLIYNYYDIDNKLNDLQKDMSELETNKKIYSEVLKELELIENEQ